MFEIGKVYRSAKVTKSETVFPDRVDGLPNFYYEIRNDFGGSLVFFERGIFPLGSVKLKDGTKRIPAIIISSSPHKSGTEMTPWEDDYDPDHGHVTYYGDAKDNIKKASEWPGNKVLLDAFSKYTSPSEEKRKLLGVPLIFLKE